MSAESDSSSISSTDTEFEYALPLLDDLFPDVISDLIASFCENVKWCQTPACLCLMPPQKECRCGLHLCVEHLATCTETERVLCDACGLDSPDSLFSCGGCGAPFYKPCDGIKSKVCLDEPDLSKEMRYLGTLIPSDVV
jgi:hypothetical protein